MILITGAAGFIGSVVAQALARQGEKLLLCDAFLAEGRKTNMNGLESQIYIERDVLFTELSQYASEISEVIHLGARTDTAEQSVSLFRLLNVEFSKNIWRFCAEYQIPLVYASSAATYGSGDQGFSDETSPNQLFPLNPYGDSKNIFDQWVLTQKKGPEVWHGLKFFNVFGPNEYHKGNMASVVFHATKQIQKTGAMRLFRSHREDVQSGHQKRDFIYVKDLLGMILELRNNGSSIPNGLYNAGTGTARTFLDLTKAVFRALDKTPQISFIDTPMSIRESYQYFTEAEMKKWNHFSTYRNGTSLEDGIFDYVKLYLIENKYF